ncbi:hypothetical protein TC41_1731 [Alicyclobacillus acidocaldarius subsp. acidocaldarius Tc-4-1]|uniref:Uncharacterized protein n=1 Tax=Alicyclobacillus acidocaldarius (strain Tc-4-1) TaxID=1048834 RepID=F8IL92_ALIAT|nr:hypothetical protein TC41_1731 [Alicyclobacillus acidocaldarius subsp. acidocaldarius Tc-4-1]
MVQLGKYVHRFFNDTSIRITFGFIVFFMSHQSSAFLFRIPLHV